MDNRTISVLSEVLDERTRQDKKWGEQSHGGDTWLVILMEEVGELAQATLKTRFGGKGNAREEAIQVAAVAVAIVEALDRGTYHSGPKIPHVTTHPPLTAAEAIRLTRAAFDGPPAPLTPEQAAEWYEGTLHDPKNLLGKDKDPTQPYGLCRKCDQPGFRDPHHSEHCAKTNPQK
jgi:NTP pyrophosphatase (non-canonical NTP hydrolase)